MYSRLPVGSGVGHRPELAKQEQAHVDAGKRTPIPRAAAIGWWLTLLADGDTNVPRCFAADRSRSSRGSSQASTAAVVDCCRHCGVFSFPSVMTEATCLQHLFGHGCCAPRADPALTLSHPVGVVGCLCTLDSCLCRCSSDVS